MFQASKKLIAAVALSAAALLPLASQAQAQQGVSVGALRCDVAGSVSFIFGSTRDISCTYEKPSNQGIEHYTGVIRQYGIDIGYLKSGVIVWGVVAPPNDVGKGALAALRGTGNLAAGYGVGANALIGGYKDSIALQPLSVEGVKGINIAAAVVGLTLKAAP
jgi:hypothetical protein